MRSLKTWKVPFACAFAVTSLPLVLIVLARSAAGPATAGAGKGPAPSVATVAAPVAEVAAPAADVVEVSLNDALGRHWIKAQYQGNGHSEIKATFASQRATPLRVTVASGTIFETADLRGQMVVARGQGVDLPAGGTRAAWLETAATRSSNGLKPTAYRLCPDTLPILTHLFTQVDQSPELSRETIQTAVLLLTENAPLGLFAKFALLSGDAPAAHAPTAFQVNTGEILAAFGLLKDAGYPRADLVAAQEPQLKIEAMIDPLAHAAALHYYNFTTDAEWAYWREELQSGDLSTRHYALYGIGRYYPEVALQMLPDWARAGQLSKLMRNSAIQAMAETHRPEAISVLQELVSEFGAATEMGQSARKAIAYLETQRAAPVSNSPVEFKLSQATLR